MTQKRRRGRPAPGRGARGPGAGRRRCPPPHTGPSCLSQPPLCVFTVPKAHPPKYLECKECFGILKNISQPLSSCNPAGPSQGPFSFPEEAKGLAGSEDTCGCHSEEGVWLGRERTWGGTRPATPRTGPARTSPAQPCRHTGGQRGERPAPCSDKKLRPIHSRLHNKSHLWPRVCLQSVVHKTTRNSNSRRNSGKTEPKPQ